MTEASRDTREGKKGEGRKKGEERERERKKKEEKKEKRKGKGREDGDMGTGAPSYETSVQGHTMWRGAPGKGTKAPTRPNGPKDL